MFLHNLRELLKDPDKVGPKETIKRLEALVETYATEAEALSKLSSALKSNVPSRLEGAANPTYQKIKWLQRVAARGAEQSPGKVLEALRLVNLSPKSEPVVIFRINKPL